MAYNVGDEVPSRRDDGEAMANDAHEEERTPATPGGVLRSDGAREASGYATAELKDSVRPTMEMDRVQVRDPRHAPTMKTQRPPTSALAAVPSSDAACR